MTFRGETLHVPIVILSASEGPHLVREVTQGKLAVREPYVRSLAVFAARDDVHGAIERLSHEPVFV